MANDILGWTQTSIFAVQTVAFIYQAIKLRETVAASNKQSEDLKESIAQSTRAANAMEKQAKAATIASENVEIVTERTAQQIRAYLSVKIGTGVYQDATHIFEVMPQLLNTGQSPAHQVRYSARADVLPFPLPDDFTFPELPPPRYGFGALGPHQDFTMNAAVQKRFDDNEAEDIKRGKGKRVYIWGTVFYEDAFRKERYSNFAHGIIWTPGPEGKGEIVFGHYADRHNDVS